MCLRSSCVVDRSVGKRENNSLRKGFEDAVKVTGQTGSKS